MNARPVFVVWLTASLSLTVPALAASAVEGEPSRDGWTVSSGPYAADPRLERLGQLAERYRREALAVLRDDWGLAPGGLAIEWRWDASAAADDGPAAREDATFELGRTFFAAGSAGEPGGDRVVVSLPVRRFLARPESARPAILHEAVHAVSASRAGSQRAYERAAPWWFREGLALVVSREGPGALDDRISHSLWREKAAASFLVGVGFDGDFEDDGRSTVSRAEAWLATRWLRERVGGGDALAGLARRVADGASLGERLEGDGVPTGSGLTVAALADARAWIGAALPAEREARIAAALRRWRAGESAATVRLSGLLAERPSGPVASLLGYLVARDFLRRPASDAREAEAMLRVISTAPGHLWRPEALVLLGVSLDREGRRLEAQACWREVLEVYGEDRIAARAARVLLGRGG